MGIVRVCRERAQNSNEIKSIDLRIKLLEISKIATDEELKAMLEVWEKSKQV